MNFIFECPTKLIFGSGKLDELSKEKMPGKKALIVISCGKSIKANGYLERLEIQLKQIGIDYALYDKVDQNPSKDTVMEGANLAKVENCDFVIALGGGSVIDASKAMAFMATNDGDLWDYISGGTGKSMPMKNKPLKTIAIPTSSGTGSEMDPVGVINNVETNEKIGLAGYSELYPTIAIVDPTLTLSVPQKLTAYQGFDALFHATECYISKFSNLMSDMYAKTSIENIAKYLPIAVSDGSNLEAREHVAFASNLSGTVMTISSTTAQHSIEHAMSAYHKDLIHGAGLIMISNAFYKFFIDNHACDEKFIEMAKLMGIKDANKPEDFLTALTDLQRKCGVDNLKMSDYGIKEDELEKIAINSKETMDCLYVANPIELTIEDATKILKESYK